MSIQNCPRCGGMHFGSNYCPIFCILCANGNDLPEGEICKNCGRTGQPIHPSQEAPSLKQSEDDEGVVS